MATDINKDEINSLVIFANRLDSVMFLKVFVFNLTRLVWI